MHARTSPWALVTGASGGLGQAFAGHLASHGSNVVLSGRNAAKLDEAADIVRAAGREAVIVPADLGDAVQRAQLIASVREQDLHIDTLVNNGGYGMVGDVATQDEARLTEMLELNVVALTQLTRAFLPAMLEAKQGSIINVASTAAFQPLAGMSAYAASKSYVLSFTQGLWKETNGTGVRVLALCPGPTETGFFDAAGDASLLSVGRRTPEQCVETAFAALKAGRPSVVDGAVNTLGAMAGKVFPSRVAIEVGARIIGH